MLQHYATTLDNPGELTATIELLQHSSALIIFFKDRAPIHKRRDTRLDVLRNASQYFSQFKGVSPKESFTRETAYDIMCTVDGLLEFITRNLKENKSIVPAFLNSDIVENHFCMVRGLFNGCNDHPTYLSYKSLQNSVILTQKVALSSKRNSNTTAVHMQSPT